MVNNVLLFIVDALRHDIVADGQQRQRLTPAIDRIVRKGTVLRVIANAATTQFVLPSLLSQTYPLDYGGYDTGIRNRPKSWVELLRDAGYHTYLATSCNQYGLAHGYDRGFDQVRGLYSASGQIRRLALRKLIYVIELFDKGEIDEETLTRTIQEELGELLEKLAADSENQPVLSWGWRRAERHNRWIGRQCLKELELLRTQPKVVINKLRSLTSIYYWSALGRDAPGVVRQWARLVSAVLWQLERLVTHLGIGVNIPKYAAYQFTVEEVLRGLGAVTSRRDKPWLAYIHLMDVHSYFFFRGFVDLARKFRFLPKLLRARRDGLTRRPILHDLALMQVDHQIGRTLDRLEAEGTLDDTLIGVMGDHGKYLAQVDGRPASDVHARTHREHLETGLAICGNQPIPHQTPPLLDSMSVAATLLEALNVEGHESFKGTSAYQGGRAFVISENAGRGSADLERKDLYFTITTNDHKLMTVLNDDELRTLALFDLNADPQEHNNIADDPANHETIGRLIDTIFKERAEIFARRGVKRAA